MDKHHKKTDGKQCAGAPNSPIAEQFGDIASGSRADGKYADHAEIGQCLFQYCSVPFMEISAKRLHAAAKVSDAHRAGVSMSVDLMECLHLKGTDKGDKRVSDRIPFLSEEANGKQERNFDKQDDLSPMDLFAMPIAKMHDFRDSRAEQKGQHRDQIPKRRRPLAGDHVRTHQDNVPRLRVSKYAVARTISIRILKTAGQDNADRRTQRIRHLKVFIVVHKDLTRKKKRFESSPRQRKESYPFRPPVPRGNRHIRYSRIYQTSIYKYFTYSNKIIIIIPLKKSREAEKEKMKELLMLIGDRHKTAFLSVIIFHEFFVNADRTRSAADRMSLSAPLANAVITSMVSTDG